MFAALRQGGSSFAGTQLIEGLVWVPSGKLTYGNRPPEFYPWNGSFDAGGANTFVTMNKASHANDASHVFTVGGRPIWEVGATTSPNAGPSDYNIKRVFGPANGGIFQDIAAFTYDAGSLVLRNKIDQETLLNPQFIQPIVDGAMFDWVVSAGWSSADLPGPLNPATHPAEVYGNARAIMATDPAGGVTSLAKIIVPQISTTFRASILIRPNDATGGSMAVVLRWQDAAGAQIGPDAVGNGVPTTVGGWISSVVSGPAPQGAVTATITVQPFSATGVWYVTAATLKMLVEPGTSFKLGIGAEPLEPLHVSWRRAADRVRIKIENWNIDPDSPPGLFLPNLGSQSAGIELAGVGISWFNGCDLSMDNAVAEVPAGQPNHINSDNWFVQWGQGPGKFDPAELFPINPFMDPAIPEVATLNPDFHTFRIYVDRFGVAINNNGSHEPTEALRVDSMGVGGFLLPRLTLTQRDAMGDKNAGLTIWNLDTNQQEQWDGAGWVSSGIGGGGSSGTGLALLAYGDSLTAGVGGTAWPGQYSNLSGFSVSNEGVGGETAIQIRDRLALDIRRISRVVVIWAGRNNLTNPATQQQADTAKQHIADMVNGLGHNSYVVLGITNQDVTGERIGEADLAIIDQLNADLLTTYAGRFVNVRRELIDNGLSIAGITPTAQDTTDIANDVIPSSLRNDILHLNSAGYGVIAFLVNTKINSLSANGSLSLGGGGGGGGSLLSSANIWTARQTFEQGIKFEVGAGGFFNPGATYADAALGVVNAGVTGTVDDWGLYTPGGLSVLRNPTGTRNVIIDANLRVAGGLAEFATGSGWLLARNVVTGGNGLDSVNSAQSAFTPLNIQTSVNGFTVNGNLVADASTALMLTGSQTVAGRKTFTDGIAAGLGGGFQQGAYYGDANLGLVIGGRGGVSNAVTLTNEAGSTAIQVPLGTTNSEFNGDVKVISATGKIGYASGSASVSQATSKTTSVTIDSASGTILVNASALAAGAEATFIVSNSRVAADDVIVLNHVSGGTAGAYLVCVTSVGAGTFRITISNVSAGSLSQALTLRFMVLRTT